MLGMLLCLIGLNLWVHNSPLCIFKPRQLYKISLSNIQSALFYGDLYSMSMCAQMHGVCTDVSFHFCFSGQQQYECRLDSIIENCTWTHSIRLKGDGFLPTSNSLLKSSIQLANRWLPLPLQALFLNYYYIYYYICFHIPVSGFLCCFVF
jgi:hypothetical protein